MEGLAALGFACNVIELIDFSFKAIDGYRHIREHGTNAQVANRIQSIEKLSEYSTALRQSLNSVPNSTQLPQSDFDLLKVCTRCSNVVQRLEQELGVLRIGPGSGRISAIRQLYRLKRNAPRIEQAKHELDNCVQDLDSSILIYLSQKMGTLANQEGNILDALKVSQQKLASAILDGNTGVRDLLKTLTDQEKTHVTQEHVLTRQHIDTQIVSLAERQARQVEYNEFLGSLHFPEINLRQDTIPDAHKKTFEWILDRSECSNQPWSNFVEWAQSDEQLYWVLGKPGSGKSTLMNFLVSDQRVNSVLDGNIGQRNALVLCFFFWEAGVDLQKNQIGLLRSLTWQLFQILDPPFALELYTRVIRPRFSRPIAWTTKQLLPLLSSITRDVPYRVFLFLDGLDEFEDVENEAGAISDVLGSLSHAKNVKLCISSRPATCLEALYNNCPKLRLQDLTRSDVARYVEDKLMEAATNSPTLSSAPGAMVKIVSRVVEKAEGVFLWVHLAVQSLIRGIRLEDEWSALEARLEQIPKGIFDLYTNIWKRVEADSPLYAKEAATYLQLVRKSRSLSLLEVAIASSPETQDVYLKDIESLSIDRLGKGIDLDRVRRRLNSLCGGFLDLHYTSDEFLRENMQEVEDSWSIHVDPDIVQQHSGTFELLSELRRNHWRTRVTFMHRTALEYLSSDAGAQLLQNHILSEMELSTRLSRCASILVMLTIILFIPKCVIDRRQSMLTYDELLEREAACEKTRSLVGANLEPVREVWAFHEGTDNIDYAKSFVSASEGVPVAYLEHKLRHTGVIDNTDYLTDMLRVLNTRKSFIDWMHWENWKHWAECNRLLLELGADPNAMIVGPRSDDSSIIDITIWQWILRGTVRSGPRSLEEGQLMSAFLRANAGTNASSIYLLCREKGSSILSTSYSDPENGFLAYEDWSSYLLAQFTNQLNGLLAEVDLKPPRRRPIVLLPQEGWFVLSTDYLRSSMAPIEGYGFRIPDQHPYHPSYYFNHMLISVNYENLVECIEEAMVPYEVFPNGNDAFRAAGWTNEEVEELGVAPQLLQQTHDDYLEQQEDSASDREHILD